MGDVAGDEVLGAERHRWLTERHVPGDFCLFGPGLTTPILVDGREQRGIKRAAAELASDIGRVASQTPELIQDFPIGTQALVIGTEAGNALIAGLAASGRLDLSCIRGAWEATLIALVDDPAPGITRALLIVGSDRRGAIFGTYALAEQLGVSPWHWWSQTPVRRRAEAWIAAGPWHIESPAVRYRGIFLNDEYPNLTRWVAKTYGQVPTGDNPPMPEGIANYGSEFYSRIFDLILRLRGNYLWPAMWNNAFNEDDGLNPALADEVGIVMGTSHQEPMVRAQKEWDRRHQSSLGHWDWTRHRAVLEGFWREGLARNKDFENLVTIGLRGADDTEMATAGPEAARRMLEEIIEVQRSIIAAETGRPAADQPQLWCLYKEVLDYYHDGLRVPEDVTLLWGEDNWGNLRRVPSAEERSRPGGAGIYYHFDYHGGPRSYQWLNTSPLGKIFDQMSLAAQYGADRVWIVNVGHLKGYELPLEYFMNLAWSPSRWHGGRLQEFTRSWAAREFGPTEARAIGRILDGYGRFNGRRKPELLAPDTYSLLDYQEAERVVEEYDSLARQATDIAARLPAEFQDSYFQAVLFPVRASALVNRLYVAAGRNALYARQGRSSASHWEAETRRLFAEDLAMMEHYNRCFAGGRWEHFMDQTHLGYTAWNDPPANSLDAIRFAAPEPLLGSAIQLGIAVEGVASAWPELDAGGLAMSFDNYSRPRRWIDIFRRGSQGFRVELGASQGWIRLSLTAGSTATDLRIWVELDWNAVPWGYVTETITISGDGHRVSIPLQVRKPRWPDRGAYPGFVESDGVVAMEAEHCQRNVPSAACRWEVVEEFGHTLSGMRAWAPVDTPALRPGVDSPVLEYDFYLFSTGRMMLGLVLAPSLNFQENRGLSWAWSLDDGPFQLVEAVPPDFNAQNGNRDWEGCVSDNARFSQDFLDIRRDGNHTLKIWMIDPGLVIQRLVLDAGGLRPSYLGPPESFRGSSQSD